MIKSLSDHDAALWQAYTHDVTPIGQRAVPRSCASRRLSAPIPPMTTLDLHGMTLAEAHATTNAFLAHCHERSVTIVTGISGAIHREFPHWLDKHPIGRIEPMNGGGAFRVHLRRRRQSIESKVQTILKDWEAK